MKKTPLPATDAARNFADCVNRVRYQNVTYVLLKNGSPVARIVPEKQTKKGVSVRSRPRPYESSDCPASECGERSGDPD